MFVIPEKTYASRNFQLSKEKTSVPKYFLFSREVNVWVQEGVLTMIKCGQNPSGSTLLASDCAI
jgi:hypothetical protein